MESLENLHILAPGRRGPARHRQLAANPNDVLGGDLPRQPAERR
jgi:hypothetical protein